MFLSRISRLCYFFFFQSDSKSLLSRCLVCKQVNFIFSVLNEKISCLYFAGVEQTRKLRILRILKYDEVGVGVEESKKKR